MKQIIKALSAAIFLVIILQACKKSNSNNSTNNNDSTTTISGSIAGKWNITSYLKKITVPSSGQVLSDTTNTTLGDYQDYGTNGIATFETFLDYSVGINQNGTIDFAKSYTVNDKDTGTVAYKVTGNYLVISEDNTLDTAIIQTITSTQLKLYEKELDTDSTSGIPYVIESWTMLSK